MYELRVENYKGEALSLTDNKNYTVTKIDGLNPPNVSISQTENALYDGSVINAVRMEARNLVFYIVINGNIESNRLNLYKYFTPKQDVKIYFSTQSRDVYIEGKVESIECDQFSIRQIAQISVLCPKPYFKDINDLISSFADINAMFEFPFSIPAEGIEFSNMNGRIRKSIFNTGDSDTGVIIVLRASGGQVVNPIIYNVLDKTYMKFNFTLENGDVITINTNVGEKSILLNRANVITNLMSYITPDSTWFKINMGDNVFTYDTEQGGGYLFITFRTTLLYCGV